MVQLHGDETPGMPMPIGWPVMRSVTLDDVDESRDVAGRDDAAARCGRSGARGGTGSRVDWARGDRARDRRVVLAGGLTPENVEEAIVTVRPFGVDVSSGVEASPGVKDLDEGRRGFCERAAAFARR